MQKIVLVLMAALCLNACSKEEETKAPAPETAAVVKEEVEVVTPETLKGKNFILKEDTRITIGFGKLSNQFFGRAVNNNYFGNYEASENQIKFGEMGVTKMAGSEEDMQKEAEYLKKLETVSEFSYKNKVLTLKGKQELVFDEFIEKPVRAPQPEPQEAPVEAAPEAGNE